MGNYIRVLSFNIVLFMVLAGCKSGTGNSGDDISLERDYVQNDYNDDKRYDEDGYNEDSYNEDGYDEDGYNEDGYNRGGYNNDGYNEDGYSEDGYDKDGYKRGGYNRRGYDEDGYDEDGYDEDGYDKEGYNEYGFDVKGYDINGRNSNGIGINEFADGTYNALVEYYNPETKYRANYDLEVKVKNNRVVKIYFPKGGYLDDDHIIPRGLDEDGDVLIYSDKDNEFQIRVFR